MIVHEVRKSEDIGLSLAQQNLSFRRKMCSGSRQKLTD